MEVNRFLSSSIIEDNCGIETIKSLTSERSHIKRLIRICGLSQEALAKGKAESLQKGPQALGPADFECLGLVVGSSFGFMKQELS